MCEGNRRIKGAIRSVPATLTEISKSRKRGPEGQRNQKWGMEIINLEANTTL